MDDNYQAQNQPQNLNSTQPTTYQPIPETPSSQPITNQQSDQQTSQQIDEQLANMSNEEIIAAFANGLLIEKGISDVDPEIRTKMVQELVDRINTFVDRAVLESLPQDKLNELNKMLDDNTATEENVAELIKNSGVNTDDTVAKALEKFRDIYLGNDENTEA